MKQEPGTLEEALAEKSSAAESAFTELFKRHAKTLTLAATAIVGEPDSADDVVQTVMLQIWKQRHDVNFTGDLLPYLQAAVQDEASNALTKNKRIRRSERTVMRKEILDLLDSSPETLLSRAQIPGVMRSVIDTLPPKTREFFQLWLYSDLLQVEVLKALGRTSSRATAHQAHSRALDALRQALIPAMMEQLKMGSVPGTHTEAHEEIVFARKLLKRFNQAMIAHVTRRQTE